MVDKELIENWRNMLKPSISSWLLKTNYKGMGEQDKEEFGRDFDEILDLALIGLKYKAQLSQERTDKRTETHASDLISRQAAIDALAKMMPKSYTPDGSHPADEEIFKAQEIFADCIETIEILPSAEPDIAKELAKLPPALNNQVNLCDSCTYTYPECPSEKDDVIFGNGIGNDNICACNKYQPTIQPVATDTNVGDTISRQTAIDALDCINGAEEVLRALPPAKPEHDAAFWRKRAEEYSNICLAMTAEMTKGIKFNSIRIDENGICFGKEQPEQKWIPCSERLPENRVSVIVCFREWQQYAKRYVYSIVVGWYARKHSVHENVFSDWEADCEYDEIEDEYYIEEGWYEFTTQGNGDLMNWYINADVIAWMPLPEPYQGGE